MKYMPKTCLVGSRTNYDVCRWCSSIKLDSMRWFSHRRGRTRKVRRTGRRPRGRLPKKCRTFLSLVTLTFVLSTSNTNSGEIFVQCT